MREYEQTSEENNDYDGDISKIPETIDTLVESDDIAIKEKRFPVVHIDQLPLEVLDTIFTYLTSRDRKNVRLVCNLWYIRGQQFAEKITLTRGWDFQALEHCGFRKYNLHVFGMNVVAIPRTVWEKIGARIYSLYFHQCSFQASAMKSIVLGCENLRALRVCTRYAHVCDTTKDLFGSTKEWEGLNVVQRRLDTFEIYYDSFELEGVDFEEWTQIFSAVRRIFPNVIHYGAGSDIKSVMTLRNRLNYNSVRFHIEFSLDKSSTKADNSGLNAVLAHAMMADNAEGWKKALQMLSTMSLSMVSLYFGRMVFKKKDQLAFLNFFADHKELQSIKFELKQDNGIIRKTFVSAWKSVLFQILNTCVRLRKLFYCDDLDWLPSLTEAQRLQLGGKISKLTKFTLGKFLVNGSNIQLWERVEDQMIHLEDFSLHCCTVMPILTSSVHLQHLILQRMINYEALQCIFKHMINLKTLEVDVYYSYAAVLQIKNNKFKGSSIKRLKNLERLKIQFSLENYDVMVHDNFYDEFEFPKLRYLYCFLPKNQETPVFNYVGIQMPSLREIDFSQTTRFYTNYTELECALDISQTIDVTRIFARCPTLRSLRYWRGTYFYEPFTHKVIFAENENK